jgi:ABC-type antimicrobial peptide transport system permease subunit
LIAAGIAVNTVVFSLIDAVLLRRLPVPDPELVQLFEIHPRIPARFYFEYGLLRNLREHSSTLTDVVGQMEPTAPITHGRTVERIHPHSVTDDYFRSLGVSAALGRVLTPGDELVAVLSDDYWRRGFGADRKVIGQTIRLYNRPFAIVGVAPPVFGGTVIDTSADLWIPMRNSYNFLDPQMPFYEVSTLAEDIGRSLWQDRMLSSLGTTFGIFSAGLALAGLYGMLAYFITARRREIGLRLALGATPLDVARLVAKHLIPTIALGLVAAAILSVVAGFWIRSLLYEIRPSDPQAIAFALGLVSLVVLVAEAMPAWRAVKTDPASSLREE